MAPLRSSPRLHRILVIAIAASSIGVALTGSARAYWAPTTGVGSGVGATGTIAISATVNGITGLYPGASLPVSVSLKNASSTAAVTILSLTQSGATTIQTAGKGSCSPAVVAFSAGTLPSGSLAPGQSGSATGTVTMTSAAADGCQGAAFAIPLTATAHTP